MLNPNFKLKVEEEKNNYGRFLIEPLEQGYGHTLGNALRRVLLTSLPGAAATAVKIEGVRHQFTAIPGLKEDVVELILNLKKLRFKMEEEKSGLVKLSVKGPGEIRGADIETSAGIEVVSKDLYLGMLTDKNSTLNVEITVEKGSGFVLAEERKIQTIGVIPVDSTFSPIKRVNYRVEATRVGRLTNLDKLILEVSTDGTIMPLEAVKTAAKILVSYFLEIYEPKAVVEEGVALTPAISEEILKMTLEEIDLPTRIYNALQKAGISTIGQLLGAPKKDLSKIKNFGAKSLAIVEEKLREKGVALSV